MKDSEFCTVCALVAHFKEMQRDCPSKKRKQKVVHLNAFLPNVASIADGLVPKRQNDAIEALEGIVDHLILEEDEIGNKFVSTVLTEITCPLCSGRKSDEETQRVIRIQPLKITDSILDLITSGFKRTLPNMECSFCHENVGHVVNTHFTTAAEVLIIHVNRHQVSKKYDEHVKFDLEIDISQLSRTDSGPNIYGLSSLIQHVGQSFERGHFNCVARCTDSTWKKLNDQTCTSISKEVVLQQKAYILIYSKIHTTNFHNH